MKNFIFVVLVLIGFKSLAQDTLKVAKVELPPVYFEKKGYKIQMPTGWRIAPGSADNNSSLFAPTDTLFSPDIYVENINIAVEKLSTTSYTVDQYATFSIGYLPKVVKNFKLVSKKKLNSSSYVVEYKGNKNNFDQTWRQFYYVKNAKVYIVTLATETPKFEYYKLIVEPFLKTFKLI
jgi:hypothetical protein